MSHFFNSFLQGLSAENNKDQENVGTVITVHLKNNIKITGMLQSIDAQMNMEVSEIQVADLPKHL